jgi:hypothetical protein
MGNIGERINHLVPYTSHMHLINRARRASRSWSCLPLWLQAEHTGHQTRPVIHG